MRRIETHCVNQDDRQPQLLAMGHIGTGGAEQLYRIIYVCPDGGTMHLGLDFVSLTQEGVTNEALLAIVIDRLEGFQAGPYPCVENAKALVFANAALKELQLRTANRIARGVENKAEV